MRKYKCSICKVEIDGKYQFGNNAEPINNGICCDKCNTEKVIPARIKILYRKMKYNSSKIK